MCFSSFTKFKKFLIFECFRRSFETVFATQKSKMFRATASDVSCVTYSKVLGKREQKRNTHKDKHNPSL